MWQPELRLVVEDGSKTVVPVERKYQALSEEEGHQDVAVEDVCLVLAVTMAAEDVCWAVGHGGEAPSHDGG